MESREIKCAKIFGLIEVFRFGNESQVAFCDRVGLKLFTFRYWLNSYSVNSVEKPGGGFVRVTGLELSSLDEIELRYPNGVRIGLAGSAWCCETALYHIHVLKSIWTSVYLDIR